MINTSTSESDHKLQNSLLFENIYWEGEGSIIILQTGATIHFTITNTFQKEAEGFLKMLQEVRLQEINERWLTHFEFCKFRENQFEVNLSNDSAGRRGMDSEPRKRNPQPLSSTATEAAVLRVKKRRRFIHSPQC